MPKNVSYTWEQYGWLTPFTPAPYNPMGAKAPESISPNQATGQPISLPGLTVTGTATVTTLSVGGTLSVTGAATLTGGAKLGNGAAAAATLWSGSGVPAAGLGANGDFYFRSDTPGTANQRLYIKSAGAWTALTL